MSWRRVSVNRSSRLRTPTGKAMPKDRSGVGWKPPEKAKGSLARRKARSRARWSSSWLRKAAWPSFLN